MIDAFAHFYPSVFLERLFQLDVTLPVFVQRAPSHCDLDFRIAELDRNAVERQVICLGTPAFDDLFPAEASAAASELARIGNDGIAEIAARYPQRFTAVATLPLVGIPSLDAALDELERTIALGFKGVQLYTRVGNVGVDDPAFAVLWERIAAHNLPVLLHPTGGSDNPLARDYLLWLTFGWPLETSLMMLRLVYGGLYERFPSLKILTHHLGAFVPVTAERIKGVNFTLERSTGTARPEPLLTSLKRFYGDTTVNGFPPALNAGYEFFGADHVLFATDYPYVPMTPQCRAVRAWNLAAADKEKILDTNARQFFGF